MKANRPHLIIIERAGAPVDDGYNTVPGGWAEFAREYAAVTFGRGTERRAAAQEQASAAATFHVLSNPKTRDVSVTDRIVFDGGAWDVIGNIPSKKFNEGRDLDAIRALA